MAPNQSQIVGVVSVILLTPCLFSFALSGQEDTVSNPYPVSAAVLGEECAVCGAALSETDVALIVKGRRVPLKKEMVTQFLAESDRYFARMQPRGALFQETGSGSEEPVGAVDFLWFAVGLYILVALLFAGLSGYTAVAKGLEPIRHFFIGLIFSAPGYLYVLTRPPLPGKPAAGRGLTKVPTTSSPVRCDACGSMNHPSSSRCSGCGAGLKPVTESEVGKI